MILERRIGEPESDVAPYPQEAILIEALSDISAGQLLCISPGLAQFARGGNAFAGCRDSRVL
jgi:hypothetical protein